MKKNVYLFLIGCGLLMFSKHVSAQSYYITTIAGTGAVGITGDGGQATAATLNNPHSVFKDASGNIFICDDYNDAIRKISTTGVITRVAGTGVAGYTGDGGPAIAATMNEPFSVIVDNTGNVFFSDFSNNVVREINTAGIINTIVGTGVASFSGDGGPASAATLSGPTGLSFDGAGNLYIGDYNNMRVRKVSPTGIISTYAGNGTAAFFGDGGPATDAELWFPNYVHATTSGDLYITDNKNQRIRLVTAATGIITTVAGNGTVGSSGVGVPATAAELNYPGGVNFDAAGNMYIAGDGTENIRIVNTSGIINNYAGNGTAGFIDNVAATSGELHTPVDVAFDENGNLIIADQQNNRIRIIKRDAVPTFVDGTRQTITMCNDSSKLLNVILTINDSDVGQTERWQLISGPYNGTITTGGAAGLTYTATSTGGHITPTSASLMYYTPTAGFSGVDSFYVRVNDSIASDTTLIVVTVHAAPTPITGAFTVCAGSTTILTDAATGGTWTSGSTSVATVGPSSGIVTGADGGIADIIYTTSCGTVAATVTVTAAPAITGTLTTCIGSYTHLADATTGGTWVSSNTAVATVVSGYVYGLSLGTDTIKYTLPTGCVVSKVVTVDGPSALSPASPTVCAGGTLTLAETTTGGTWGSSATAVATVTSGGVVTGATIGTSIISYTASGCIAYDTVTVNSGAGVITPTGAEAFCEGSTVPLADAVSGGIWSSLNTAIATVDGVGDVSGVSGGTTTITYSSGSCYTTKVVTVVPYAPITPASSTVCVGSSETFTEPVVTLPYSGAWISVNTAVATISASGTLTGVSPGIDTIAYGIYNGPSVMCSSYTAVVTVNTAPAAITPSGTGTVCIGSTIALADATTGGSWSSTPTTVATVSATGVVYGVITSSAIIYYSIGSCSVYKPVNVTNGPAAISPATASICIGTTTTLTETATGGVWSSSNTAVATVASGTVHGVSAGTATIDYTVGSCFSSATVTVNSSPVAITPTGTVAICSSGSTTLSEATTGGAWGSSNTAIATVSGGSVYGVSAGTATISYSVGSCYATKAITVISGPAAILPTSPIVCTGSTLALTDATSGGTWSSSSTGTATVSGSGVVFGTTAGTTTINYSTGSCSATTTVTIVNAPSAITPTSAVTICEGSTTTLADAVTGGSWSSSTTGTATVSAAGVVTGIATGTATITYTEGLCYVTKLITISAGPATILPGSPTLCAGTTLTLTDGVSGGTWSSSSAATATVGTTGVVNGVSAGTVNIYYIIGSCLATATVTVTPSPSVGTISGTTSLCVGSTTPLSDAATGGVWSSSNTIIASVSGTGLVYGLSTGTATISYSNTSSCGVIAATHVVTVNTTPSAGTITGPTGICAGTTVALSNPVTGGTWFASNSNASVNITTGLLTGVTPGIDTITYKVITSCGIASTTAVITVGSFLSAGTISGGTSSLCGTTTITLTDAGSSGGAWSSSNSSATIGSTGVVTGAAAGGIDTIYYTVTASCGTAAASYILTINPAPEAGSISGGVSTICTGTTATLTAGTTGGTWSAANTDATVSGGVVTGAAAGTDVISYSVTNGCGTAVATYTINVTTTASAGTITGPSTLCAGAPVSLSDGVVGGTWSSGNTAIAVVSSGGVVSAVSPGAVTIYYTVVSSCGSAVASYPVVVSGASTAGSLSGPSSICVGYYTSYTPGATGGTWSISNSHATISSSGVVTGISPGIDTITYVVSNSCGTTTATSVITIDAAVTSTIGPISSLSIVCVGSGITLVDATPGGTWAASNGHAIVVGAGIIDGVSPGIDTISYLVTGACGTSGVTKVLNVDTIPIVAPITGATTQCVGSTLALSDPDGGGIWTTSTAAVGTVTLYTGVVLGVSAGTTTITYTVTNLYGCPGSVTITDVVTPPTISTGITGSSSICAGATTTLTNATAGGSWSSSNTAVAVIDPASGNVTGVSAGTTIISYTIASSCGVSTITSIETINALPTVTSISGAATGCVGSAVSLSDATVGGVWSSSSTAIATVDGSGNVTGVASGLVTINYTVTGALGCSATASTSVFINPAPSVAAITGTAIECAGSSTTLSDGTGGGSWSSSNTAVAIVDGSGDVTGVIPGTVTISYTITGSGCPGIATVTDVVSTIPVSSPVTGTLHVCAGATTALGNAIPGGVWSSGSTGTAIVDATSGVVTGLSGGTAEIYYAASNSCGSALDSASVTIYAGPPVGAITAAYTALCTGNMLDVTDAVTGGIWGSTNTTIASISTTGVVLGTSAGIDTIYYVTTNSHGCSSFATLSITIGGAIGAAAVTPTGATELCVGHTEYMHVTSAGATSYQWLLGGSAITGATDNSYTTSTIGNYAVIVSNGICSETVSGPSVTAAAIPVISFISPDILYTSTFTTYQWFRNGVLIAGTTGNTIDESAGGIYTVVVTDAYGCSDTSLGYAFGGTTGINGLSQAQDIKVYPNPATSVIHIDAPTQVNVSVLSIDGKLLIEQKNATDIDISTLADGMYMVLVYDQSGTLMKTAKFAKVD